MHYFRGILATTFVTAVLATPFKVHFRRDGTTSSDVTVLIDAFNETNTAVQTLNDNIKNLSQPTDESGVQKFFDSLSTATVELNGLEGLTASFNKTLDEDDSRSFLNGSFIPLLASLNDTAKSMAQQASVIACFGPFQYSIVATTLESIVENFNGFESLAGEGLIASDAVVGQLRSASEGVLSIIDIAITTLGIDN